MKELPPELPSNPTESVRRRNPHLYPEYTKRDHNFDRFVKEFDKHHPQPKPPKRIRQSTKPLMNKLETEFFAYIQSRFPGKHFKPQSLRFKLANGLWYKPDVVSFDLMTCWECKGPYAFRGGFENLKVAASQYQELFWKLCWKDNDGRWKEQIVLP